MQTGHPPVPWAGAQIRCQVQAAAETDQGDAPDHEQQAKPERAGRRDHLHTDLQRTGNDDGVGNRSQPGSLPKGNPQKQDDDAQNECCKPDRHRSVHGKALSEDGPRTVA